MMACKVAAQAASLRTVGYPSVALSRLPIGLSVLLLLMISVGRGANAIWWDVDAEDSLYRLHEQHCPDGTDANSTLQVCKLSMHEVASLIRGARTGIALCQLQSGTQRWNCSSSNWNVFLAKLHKEAAYVHAVISVAVSWQLVEDCNKGNLPTTTICGASASCSETTGCTKQIITYGYNTAKILDWLHDPDQLSQMKFRQAIVHNHNREVGRVLIKRFIKRICRCKGISASCVAIRCFHLIPSLPVMIHNLTGNIQMLPWKDHREHVSSAVHSLRKQAHGKTRLIYMKKSPTFCCPDASQGILGTEGRVCYGKESCKKICCSSQVAEVTTDVCNCKFNYCCHLHCERCPTRVYRCMKPSCAPSASSTNINQLP